jgi:hypothetical protein
LQPWSNPTCLLLTRELFPRPETVTFLTCRTIRRKLIRRTLHNPAIRILEPPQEIAGFRYAMTLHPRLNTDAAHSWLRSIRRQVGVIVASH